jgi:hypothetical protein
MKKLNGEFYYSMKRNRLISLTVMLAAMATNDTIRPRVVQLEMKKK